MNAHLHPTARQDEAPPAALVERSTYQRARGGDPIATLGALVVALGTVATFAFMHPSFVHKEKRERTVVMMMELPDDPPAAEEPPPPAPDAPPPTPQISAPVPLVALQATPAIVAPPPVPQPAPPAPKAAPPAPNAVVAKAPENVGDLSAQVVFRKPIRVPFESRRAHEEGVVVLAVLLAVDGHVEQISVATSSGFPRLDRAALDAVEDWRWSPLVRNGAAVMVRGLVRVPFIREHGGRDGPDGRGGRGGRHHGDDHGRGGDRFEDDEHGPGDPANPV